MVKLPRRRGTATTLEEKLDIFLRALPKLQAAGVTAIKLDGFEACWVLPRAEAGLPETADASKSVAVAPIDDPVSYGRPEGTQMPDLRKRLGLK